MLSNDSMGLHHVKTDLWGAMQYSSTSVTWSQANPVMSSSKVRSATQRIVTGHAMWVHATPVKLTVPWLLKSGGVAPAGLPDPKPQHQYQPEGAPTRRSWLNAAATISSTRCTKCIVGPALSFVGWNVKDWCLKWSAERGKLVRVWEA